MPISLLCWRRWSEKIFCWYLKWYIIKVNKLSNNRTIQLRFWFVHFLYIARFQISPWESPYIFSTRIKAVLPLFVLKVFIQTLSWFIFLAIPTSVFQVCKIFPNFLYEQTLFIYEIEVFFWKCEHFSIFQLYFPFLDQGVQLIYALHFELLSSMNYEHSQI